MIRNILIISCLLAASLEARNRDIDYKRKIIERGGTMAWARHVTGQDTEDLTQWDKFKSVAVIPGRSAKANGDTRLDDEVWVVVDRGSLGTFIEQFQALDWGDDSDYCWFVDAGVGGADVNSYGRDEVPGTPEIPGGYGTYKLTFISENRIIWGVPVGDGEMIAGLDVDGVAVDIGGGVVGLPYAGHPFTAGEVVRINGTTNYDGADFTVLAGTTADQIQITDSYVAETFDGSEIVVQYIFLPVASGGRMDMDADGNLYHGHNWYAAGSNFITKVEPDGTQIYDFFEDAGASTANLVNGLKVNSASTYLYMYLNRGGLAKYNLATGALEWSLGTGASGTGYYMVLDSEDNVYFKGGTTDAVTKYSSADGSVVTQYTNTQSTYGVYALAIDEDMDIVVAGGYKVAANDDDTLWNLIVRTLDNSSGAKIALGGTYPSGAFWYTYIIGTGAIITHDGYIYVLAWTPTCTLYKLDTDLNIIEEVAGPTYGQGLYVDLWDNIIVVNQDSVVNQDDVLWFYDSDLNYLSKISGMYASMLETWSSAVGGAWIQGDAVFDGELETATPGTPGIPGVEPNQVDGFSHLLGMDVCVYADGIPLGVFTVYEDANGTAVIDLGAEYDVVIAGINYYSIYESFPVGEHIGRKTQIYNVRLDLHETMGVNLGVGLENSSAIQFSEDDFATAIPPYTGPKYVSFPRGVTRDPILYLWLWDPVPMSIRGLYPTSNIFSD